MNALNPIPRRLKELRREKGWSQKELGIIAGLDEFVASTRINRYETGKHIPDFYTVLKFSKVFRVPPAYFYTADDNTAEMIKIFSKLKNMNKLKIIEIMKNMA